MPKRHGVKSPVQIYQHDSACLSISFRSAALQMFEKGEAINTFETASTAHPPTPLNSLYSVVSLGQSFQRERFSAVNEYVRGHIFRVQS